MNLRISLLLILSILSATLAQAQRSHSHLASIPKEDISKLNKVMKAASIYESDKAAHLDSMAQRFAMLPASEYAERWRLADALSSEYLSTRADSSLVYAEKALAIALHNDMMREILKSRIAKIKALSTQGIFTQATAEFNSIDSYTLPKDIHLSYLEAGRRLYGYMRAMVEGEKNYYNQYTAKYLSYNDSLVNMLPENSKFRNFLVCEHLITTGRYSDAKPILEKLLKNMPERENLYGMAAFQLATVYNHMGDETAYASWLAKAAVSDIKGCVNDGWALPTLAYWLYEQGELNDAFRYINFALEDAMAGNVRIRTIAIAAMLPMIDKAYRDKINASRDELMVYFLLVTFLLIISGVLLSILMRQIKKSKANALKLARTSKLQESYIGHFIGLSSTYATRLQTLQKTVTRKISAGQSDELVKMISNGKFSDGLNEEFHTLFDSAFLDIYPDFIKDVNTLLRPEEQIALKNDKTLTPELRIYAFVRLGIEESTKIAQILNYSVSTVYAYRNRMRNKAIDRENFDRDMAENRFGIV